MALVDLVPLVDEGLGNSAYLVDLGDGRALLVDVSLDLRAASKELQRRGLRPAFVAETHLHADFASGARQLGTTGNAQVFASAAGRREFAHTGLHDGDEVDLGGLRLRALATPGHTDEHLSFLLLDGDQEVGVFTGGSLIVGSAARTDLVDPDGADAFARQQYSSLQRLLALPDDTAVWPTHGAGSFCSAPAGGRRTSTIGHEKQTNRLLHVPDEDAFVKTLLGSLGTYPPYFRRTPEINRVGLTIPDGGPKLPSLDVAAVKVKLAEGAHLVDVRSLERFANVHIPGAVSIPLRPVFPSWLGWLAPADEPVVIVRDLEQNPDAVAWLAAKIGYTNLVGELDGGIAAWSKEGEPTTGIRLMIPAELRGESILDVRQTPEFVAGHVPGAMHIELGDVAGRAEDVPREPTVVMCGHGERAMGAASLLERAGHRDLAVLEGGPEDWVDVTRRRLETGA